MGLFHSPRIVTDGLVMALDAANAKSYPGSGTTWNDISGNGNNATLNSVTHKSDNGGVFETAGALTSYIDNNTINLTSTNFTVFCASRYSNLASAGRVVNALSNNFLVGHHGGRAERYYAQGWLTYGAGSALTEAQGRVAWRVYHACGDISGDSYDFYVNERTILTGNNAGAQGPNGLLIGKSPYSAEPSEAHTAFVYYYNRVLTK
ncbi:MAG: LamG domain-containing protein, partial [Bacteroidota bacterium]|nr:LamG domain-containing protein [Bacteroidota bacterium]